MMYLYWTDTSFLLNIFPVPMLILCLESKKMEIPELQNYLNHLH